MDERDTATEGSMMTTTTKARLATVFAQLRDGGFDPRSVAGWLGDELERRGKHGESKQLGDEEEVGVAAAVRARHGVVP
jgi:hypothetical protein